VRQDPAPIELEVRSEEAGERLDAMLSRRALGLSRAAIAQLIEAERIELPEGRKLRASLRVREGERIMVRPLPPPPSAATPEDLPISVLHEDEHVLVVMKAAGMVVHPAPGHVSGTLVNALLHRQSVRELEAEETERPGIVHRLDKDTSGVMVVAKTMRAREGLVAQFQTHALEREYWAIALGTLRDQRFDTWHGRHSTDRKRFTGRVAQGKRAVTHVQMLESWSEACLVACRLETGRTHQIRVHLSEAGHPLLADTLYGRAPRGALLEAASVAIGRQALHARVLGFDHPVSGEHLHFEAEPPADFMAALAVLRAPHA